MLRDDRDASLAPSILKVLRESDAAREAWEDLPTRVAAAVSAITSLIEDPCQTDGCREVSRKVVATLAQFRTSPLPWEKLRRLPKLVDAEYQWTQKTPGCEKVAEILHNTVAQKTAVPLFRPLSAVSVLRKALAACDLPGKLAESVDKVAGRLLQEAPTFGLLQEAMAILREVGAFVPGGAGTEAQPRLSLSDQDLSILIVEDDSQWAAVALSALERAKVALHYQAAIGVEIATTVQHAVDCLQESRGEYIIVVLDLILPRSEGQKAQRAVGLQFLDELRSYATNHAVIVLTVPSHDGRVHSRIIASGVPENYLIYKDATAEDHLTARLKAFLEDERRPVEVRFPAETEHVVILDGVRVCLTPSLYRVLRTLAQLSVQSRGHLKPERILDAMGELFVEPSSHTQPFEKLVRRPSGHWVGLPEEHVNVVVSLYAAWSNATQLSGGHLGRSMAVFEREAPWDLRKKKLPVIMNWLVRKHGLDDWENLTTDLRAQWLERSFGGVPLSQADDSAQRGAVSKLEKQIHDLRKEIHKEFSKIPRYCDPRRVIRTSVVDEHVTYNIPGRITFERRTEPFQRRLCILVIENERTYLERLVDLLESHGHEAIPATNRDDAIRLAGRFTPDIISLDLHIPGTPEEFEANPFSGDKLNGSQVLTALARTGCRPKVVIPTVLADEEGICQQVLALGHRRPDVIDKRAAGWENWVLSSVDRFTEELRLGALLPALTEEEGLRVEVLPETSFGERSRLVLLVNGKRVKPFQGKQARLLGRLLCSPRSAVDVRSLDSFIYQRPLRGRFPRGSRVKEKPSALKQLVKNVRNGIRTWFQETSDRVTDPAKQVLKDAPGGYQIDCSVTGISRKAIGLEP